MNQPPECSGYDAKNMASLDRKYICKSCQKIVKNSVQLNCGHRICQLHVSHENSDIQCPECSETTPVAQIKLDRGFNNEMLTLLLVCYLCEWSGQLKVYEAHLQQSHNQYRCSYCNESFNSVNMREQHIDTTCLQAVVDCYLASSGCKKQILRRNLSQHYLTEEHQRILLLIVLQLIATTINNNPQQLAKFDTHIDQHMIDIPHKITTTTSIPLVTDECNNMQVEYINETIDILNRGTEVLCDELQQINTESLQQSQLVEAIDQKSATLQTSNEETDAALNALNTNLTILEQKCSSLKQNVEEIQFTSYDGTFVWKITDVKKKMVDAQSERQVSVYSPPFYSSPSGYKMCARLYLFGDGNARRTHMSLFFVLMRSFNDSLLQFPFSYKVIFALLDQSGQQHHIIESFRPDTRSSSFQRPRCEMNIASGIPKFVSLSTIQQPDNPYIKEDTMFIKIMVDFENLSKTMLPYAFSLNPGMPASFQQRMIQQEIEQRAFTKPQSESLTSVIDHKGATNNNQQQVDSDNMMKK